MPVIVKQRRQPKMLITTKQSPDGKIKRVVRLGPSTIASAKKVPRKSLKPEPLKTDLSLPGRLRVSNLMSAFNVSRSTLYSGINSGRYPEPDGKDGRLPYWNNETVRRWLEDGPPLSGT